jgi:CheY-like chemotaxis protein
VVADANQLEMALLNLSVNARDAMPGGGELQISVSAELISSENEMGLLEGEYVSVSVADSGTGMDPETARRAIEPFFSTKGIGQGTGLGLSMAHGLAAQLGGGLSIHSNPGSGTIVSLFLPRSTELPEEYPSLATKAETEIEGKFALLVDDEELVRNSAAEMLDELGYTVHQASSAEEAIHLLNGGLSVDVLVSDHLMPGMSGAELARLMLAEKKVRRVLIISGYAEEEGLDFSLPRLTKPFRQHQLAAALSSTDPVSAENSF